MPVEPYLYFNGRCEEAMEYYEKTLGAKRITLMRFKETPDDAWQKFVGPDNGNKIMHALMHIADSSVMFSDGMCNGQIGNFSGFDLTLSSASESDTEKYFNALAADGEVKMPLSKTFFAKSFGMLKDKFGVGWGLITPANM